MENIAARIVKFGIFQIIINLDRLRLFFIRLSARDGFITKNIQGSLMSLDASDEGISSDLLLYGIREPNSTKTMHKIINKGDVVIDIGANIGYYALMESKIVGNFGKVYAIEPVAQNASLLKKNITLNKRKNIQVYQIGIGDKAEKVKMNLSSHSNLHSILNRSNSLGSIMVDVVPLDQFLGGKKSPDFIRMDVEGYEFNVLQGMKNLFRSKKKFSMFMEIHPHIMGKEKTLSMLKLLKNNGFEIEKAFRCFTLPEMKLKSKKDYDYSGIGIDGFIRDENIVGGKLGAFEVFFSRK